MTVQPPETGMELLSIIRLMAIVTKLLIPCISTNSPSLPSRPEAFLPAARLHCLAAFLTYFLRNTRGSAEASKDYNRHGCCMRLRRISALLPVVLMVAALC